MSDVRALAIVVIRDGDRIFVAEYHDAVKNETFYRPIGGSIEFGEKSTETVAREAREEIGAALAKLRYLGVVENIFTYQGERGHEIVLVYEGDFVDREMYEIAKLEGKEDDGTPLRAVWRALEEFRAKRALLYPTGLLELLDGVNRDLLQSAPTPSDSTRTIAIRV